MDARLIFITFYKVQYSYLFHKIVIKNKGKVELKSLLF
jgi:hypothetical protein